MKFVISNIFFLLFLWASSASGQAFTNTLFPKYDYTATIECLANPEAPQYGGGIISNAEFNIIADRLNIMERGLEARISKEGNVFMVLHNTTRPLYSFSQNLQLEEGNFYAFSAWIQINKGPEPISAFFKTPNGKVINAGASTAQYGCWSFLKGGFHANFSTPVELYFENKNQEVEVWVDNISLQPFTKEQWRSHQSETIEKVRKSTVRILATDADGTRLAGAKISLQQTRPGFPIGCAVSVHLINNTKYQNWFASRFKYATFANEMKWYSNERFPGQEDYYSPDTMLAFANQHNISVRGHNVFWDKTTMQPHWVKNLQPEELRKAASKRMDSVVSRYRGKVIAWDVVNENLHWSFFEDRLGKNFSAAAYMRAHQLDPNTPMFLNEFNTIEENRDISATVDKYLAKILEIKSYPGNEQLPIGIGLQSHFPAGQPNLAYMRSSLDRFAATRLPIWLTEVDSDHHPNQAQNLEQILREGFAHPAVEGMIIWAGPQIGDGCDRMCMTDYDYKNTPAGDVVDKLMKELNLGSLVTTDDDGYVEASLFHGEFTVTLTHPSTNTSTIKQLNVVKESPKDTLHVQVLG